MNAAESSAGQERAQTVMAQEIAEQPGTIARTLEALLPLQSDLRRLFGNRRQVLLYGRGTSDNAANYGQYLLEIWAGLRSSLGAASLATHYQVAQDLSSVVVVIVSQSGATDEMLEVATWARANGARTVAITNEAASPLTAQADLALVTRAGPEIAVPATKTYTAQLVAFGVLADALAPDPGGLTPTLWQVPAAVEAVLTQPGLDEVGALLAASGPTIVTGRGLVYGTALELALKLEETCLVPVRGLSFADLRHGPIAVVDGSVTAVLVTANEGPLVASTIQLAGELASLGAQTVLLGGVPERPQQVTRWVPGPNLPEVVAPIALAVSGQRLVEDLARRLGVDPDSPRSLSKVTDTEPPPRQVADPSPSA